MSCSTKGYSDIQTKVRAATSNDPFGPSGTQMNEIAQATFNQQDFIEIMVSVSVSCLYPHPMPCEHLRPASHACATKRSCHIPIDPQTDTFATLLSLICRKCSTNDSMTKERTGDMFSKPSHCSTTSCMQVVRTACYISSQ